MSSQNNTTTTNNNKENAARCRSSTALASMGNFDNEPVDRSSETVLTRKQKRANRRSTLRLQSEVAPFLGMGFSDEEDAKDETRVEAKEVKQAKEMKEDESEKKGYKDEGEAEKEK
ncbi:uncharacterized protein FPRO_10564 [Fusarium proliferatum ET1]|uniref:Uncharacterized protein n=1 Tax=Fusarium proliferatum (strain ET1) TaxID=1227346 RepID=A0A1L7VN12_FUSPR|nr:uncharacterized protein FPRO_10564 [Fusarium proliferatum ET1]CZR40975.1 uncharacterized protein FPRO_10564 [Fusarium proliferatum ET1]